MMRTLAAVGIMMGLAAATATAQRVGEMGPHGPIRNLPGPTPSSIEVWGNTQDHDGAPLVVVRVQQGSRATRPDERHLYATATLSPAEARAMGEALIAWAEQPTIEGREILFSRYDPTMAGAPAR